MDNRYIEYSKRKLAFIPFGFFIAILLILLAFLYTREGVFKVLLVFGYCVLVVILLVPFLLPIFNIPLVLLVDYQYDFILGIFGLEGDAFMYSFIWYVAISYMALGYFLLMMTILAFTVIMDNDTLLKKLVEKLTLIKPKK